MARVGTEHLGNLFTDPGSLPDHPPRTGDRNDALGIARLYDAPLPATRTGAVFNAFSYPTKISAEVVALFIALHTQPGATILDPFAGSGSTGVAAKLCDHPTVAMKEVAERLGLQPMWGPRNAVLYDVSALGSFVSRVMCSPPDPVRFRRVALQLLDIAEERYGSMYRALDTEGREGVIRYAVWSDLLICPTCHSHIPYWDACVRFGPLQLVKEFTCPTCLRKCQVAECERAVATRLDPFLGIETETKLRVPSTVYGSTGGSHWSRPACNTDLTLIDRCASAQLPDSAPRTEVAWGDLFRSGYHKGISHLHQFYTPRNFLAMSQLWSLVNEFDEDLRDPLRFLILSYNATHATLMTRVVIKKGQRDLVLTGAQSGVLYISGLPVEKNVFLGIRRKLQTIVAAFSSVFPSRSSVEVKQASCTRLDLSDGAVDYIFTDPPFGDFIPYAEVNQLNEAWLGTSTNRAEEIVISRHSGKDVQAYERLMAQAFVEMSRVLRGDAHTTLVFHSARSDVWQGLSRAIKGAGFQVERASVLNKVQASFKQVVSANSVRGDPLLLLRALGRRESYQPSERLALEDLIDAVLAEARDSADRNERSAERAFSRLVAQCLMLGVPLTVSAAEFYRTAAGVLA